MFLEVQFHTSIMLPCCTSTKLPASLEQSTLTHPYFLLYPISCWQSQLYGKNSKGLFFVFCLFVFHSYLVLSFYLPGFTISPIYFFQGAHVIHFKINAYLKYLQTIPEPLTKQVKMTKQVKNESFIYTVEYNRTIRKEVLVFIAT